MAIYGLMIDYEYCSGCHSCEVACKNEKGLGIGDWGIKLAEVGPFQHKSGAWEHNYIPVPTKECDLCGSRVAEGDVPSCVLHCLASVIEYGTVEELAAKMNQKGTKVSMFIP